MTQNKQEVDIGVYDVEDTSPILENYLKIIFQEEFEIGLARTGSIAEKAHVSSATVTSTLKILKKMGYISYNPYKFIKLTEKGLQVARKVNNKFSIFHSFLTGILKLDHDNANKIACSLEHIFDNDTFEKFNKLIFFLMNDPYVLEHWQNNMETKSKNIKKKSISKTQSKKNNA